MQTQKTSLWAKIQPLPLLALVLLINTALFFTARLGLLYFLLPDITATEHIAEAMYIGLKFDARYAVFLSLPVAFCLLVPALERRLAGVSSRVRTWLCAVEGFLFGLALIIVMLDFGFFFYLRQRFDFTAFQFLEDPLISAAMVWESYPVLAILAAFALAVAAYIFLLNALLRRHHAEQTILPALPSPKKRRMWRVGATVVALLMLFVMGYGQVSSNLFPLRWSNAYFSADNNITLLALHPIQNLYDTRRYGKAIPPSINATREAWPRMAQWLGIPPQQAELNFTRRIAPKATSKASPRPNVVIILMESLAWPRTSFAATMLTGAAKPENNHALDATPFLKELAERSLYFSNFYAPTRTTARAVFTTLSGVPDVNHSGGTTSRNPKLADQSTIFNEFRGYEKYYMIGGSASWANIRGVLQHNVASLNLLEESAWESPNVDVWGISDLALLKEAVGVLSSSPTPFITFVQTAGFHRPYTIPADNENFPPMPNPSAEALRHYGFESAEEFQSLRFSDWALRRFFDRASQEPWFDNTIFAIFGDHGLTQPSTNMSPGYLAAGLQAWHTPLLLYSPSGLIPAGVVDTPHTQLDVFPTLAALAGLDFLTNTLGRDMLDEHNAPLLRGDEAAFISADDNNRFLIKDGYVYVYGQDALYSLNAPTLENLRDALPDIHAAMRREVTDFYETSRYLLHNNGKEIIDKARKLSPEEASHAP